MRIQNYGDDGNDRRPKLRGYHPPACTCFRCNEERLAKEAAEEEQRRVAEYDKRVVRAQSKGAQMRSGNRDREANAPTASLRRWLLLIAVIAGVVFAVLYVTDSGPFADPEEEGHVAIAASPLPKEVLQKSSRVVPTSMATRIEVANNIP